MPKFKVRRDAIFMNGISASGTTTQTGPLNLSGTLTITGSPLALSTTARVTKDIYISPFVWGGTGSPLASGTGASLTDMDCLGGCWPAIRFGHVGSTCPIFTVIGAPLDADSTASASLLIDWSTGSAGALAGNIAVWAASVFYLKSGSTTAEWTSAGSGQVVASLLDTSACTYGSAVVATFNAINGSPIGIRLIHNSESASDGSGSNTLMLGARVRYTANKLGA